jgi:CRP/FNR family cyclic AMP-dependent transcriptional regulator
VDAKDLNEVPLFAGLSRKDREQVAAWADVVDEPEGYHLVDQGHYAYEFFVLLDGAVAVRRDDVHLTDLGPGDFFGEIALVEDERRTATVTATTPIRAVVMHSRAFRAMRASMPSVAAQIEAAVREREPEPEA